MKPVRNLDDEEELEKEGHGGVRITVPEVGDVVEVLPHDHVSTPDQ